MHSVSTWKWITIAKKATPIYFVALEDGRYAISNGEEYVNYAGTNDWDMVASASAYGWTMTALAEGGYTITGKNGFLGTNTYDGNGAGSPCYGDKMIATGNCIWNIEKAEVPEPQPDDIDAVGADAVKANGKYLENGRVVIYRNGIKYGADGSVVK